jgi:hypothetical protein
MITHFLVSIAATACIFAMLGLLGWGVAMLFEHHFRIFATLVSLLAMLLFYIEIIHAPAVRR